MKRINKSLYELCALLLVFGFAACAKDPLSSREHIAGWANAASALGVFTHGYEALAFTDGELFFDDPNCPQTSDDGRVVEIVGGCTDNEGRSWVGVTTILREGSDRRITFASYGKGDPEVQIAELSGEFVVVQEGPGLFAFTADLRQRGGVDTEILYEGRVEGGYDEATLWNGQGRVYRDSLAIHSGTVEATTVGQFRDNDICPGEGISGSTTLVSDEHTIRVDYDGATDCDEEQAARWSRNGEPQGLLPGVACATAAGSTKSPPWLFLVLMLGLWFRLRRS